jgi:hypothetical protein
MKASAPLGYRGHVEAAGVALFERVCELDLEGIVAEQRHAPYVTEREQSAWYKIRDREYSQMAGREELFERDRRSESVPGWQGFSGRNRLNSQSTPRPPPPRAASF